MRQGNNGRRPRGGRPNRRPGPLKSQTFDSNGPDVRIRGNAHQVYEKYLGLARDAMTGGDRVLAESYYQFAEHYYRIIHESTDPDSPGSHRPHFRDPRYDDRDGDWQDRDFDGQGGGEEPGEAPYGGQREGGQRDGGHRDGGQREGGQREGGQRDGGQSHGQQGHQGGHNRPRDEQRGPREDRRPPREEPRVAREEPTDDDRAGLERALGGGQARGEGAEANEQQGRPQGGPGAQGGREFRGRNRFRRRYQGAEEEAAGGRRPFPPRDDEPAAPAAEPAPAEGSDEG